jgi:hypothetical protein
MSVHRKLVSVLLAVLVPTLSAIALSACPQQMAAMGNSQSQMAMMDMISAQLSFTALSTNLCCQVSAAEIVSAPVRASAGNDARLIPLAAVAAGQISQAQRSNISYRNPQATSPSAQAFLCVFLI